MSNTPHDHGLDKCATSHVPLSPLSFPERTAQLYAGCPSPIHGARRFARAETYTRCSRLASTPCAHGIRRGDSMAVMLPTVPARVEAHHGVPMTGAVRTPLDNPNTPNTRLGPEAIALTLARGEARGLLVAPYDSTAHCREQVERCVQPKIFTGKVRKFVLRQQAKSSSAIE